jgi:hypothetical protein
MRKERIKQAAAEGSGSTIPNLRGDGGKLGSLTREAVEKLAYQYWLDRGCPEGSAAEDWLHAEQTLLQTASKAGKPDTGRIVRGRGEADQPSTLGAVMKAGG